MFCGVCVQCISGLLLGRHQYNRFPNRPLPFPSLPPWGSNCPLVHISNRSPKAGPAPSPPREAPPDLARNAWLHAHHPSSEVSFWIANNQTTQPTNYSEASGSLLFFPGVLWRVAIITGRGPSLHRLNSAIPGACAGLMGWDALGRSGLVVVVLGSRYPFLLGTLEGGGGGVSSLGYRSPEGSR